MKRILTGAMAALALVGTLGLGLGAATQPCVGGNWPTPVVED